MNRKMRIYPPVIVATLAFLTVMIACAVSIVAEAERQATIQSQAAEPIMQAISTASPTEGQATAESEVTPEPKSTYTSAIYSRDWNGEDSRMLLQIAMAEAEGESVEGKALVMLVVLNRVWDDAFPDTIKEVIFQKNQFSPVADGGRYWTTEPNEGCYEALEMVRNGWDESQGALYFESCEGDNWHSRNLEYLFREGNHKFYR